MASRGLTRLSPGLPSPPLRAPATHRRRRPCDWPARHNSVQKRKGEKEVPSRGVSDDQPVCLSGGRAFLRCLPSAAAFGVSRRAPTAIWSERCRPPAAPARVAFRFRSRSRHVAALSPDVAAPNPHAAPPIPIRWALALGGGALCGRRPYAATKREMTSDHQPVYCVYTRSICMWQPPPQPRQNNRAAQQP